LDEAKNMGPEKKAQKFAADCVIMTETLRRMVKELHEAVV
jgi:DNA recombination-dependent growth factor C